MGTLIYSDTEYKFLQHAQIKITYFRDITDKK